MRIGILSDTHDELRRTRVAVRMLCEAGAETLIHCGDFVGAHILEECTILPTWFVFGNNDSDTVPALRQVAASKNAICLEWGGIIEIKGKQIGITHGHMSTDMRRLLAEKPDYLFSGHSHYAMDEMQGSVRRINPGALHRAENYTVALLDLETGELKTIQVAR